LQNTSDGQKKANTAKKTSKNDGVSSDPPRGQTSRFPAEKKGKKINKKEFCR